MINFTKLDNTDTLKDLRSKLYRTLTVPIDAMWEQLYIDSSQHYSIKEDNDALGYCCISEEGCLLQLFLEKKYYSKMIALVGELIASKMIQSANLGSHEPIGFNACLFYATSVKPHTFCFEHPHTFIPINSSLELELASFDDMPAIKAFFKEQVGMDDTFGYTENLIRRKELFMVKGSAGIMATSECRMSDSQPEIADIGIIVSKNYQNRNIGTQIMQMQANRVLKAHKKPICSTTVENIASRKMIEKSGFYCSAIIFDIRF